MKILFLTLALLLYSVSIYDINLDAGCPCESCQEAYRIEGSWVDKQYPENNF